MSDLPTIPRTKYVWYEPIYLSSPADQMPTEAWLFLWVGKKQDRRSMVTFEGRDKREVMKQMRGWIKVVRAKALTKRQADRLLDIYNGRRRAA